MQDPQPAAAADTIDHDSADVPLHASAEPETYRFGVVDDLLVRDAACRADVMVKAAVAITCTLAQGYEHEGRGPHLYDDIGFVRAVVQAASDWEAYRDLQPRPEELEDYRGYAAEQSRYNPDRFTPTLEAWGLVQALTTQDGNLYELAQPGDVMLNMGRGPALGVVIAPHLVEPDWTPPAVAYARVPDGPKIIRQSLSILNAVAIYRWPEAEG